MHDATVLLRSRDDEPIGNGPIIRRDGTDAMVTGGQDTDYMTMICLMIDISTGGEDIGSWAREVDS